MFLEKRKKKMAKNITKGWKTTLVGLLILASAIASIFLTERIGWADLTAPILIGIALIFSPDSILTKISNLFSNLGNILGGTKNQGDA
jgi:hypothetical protein